MGTKKEREREREREKEREREREREKERKRETGGEREKPVRVIESDLGPQGRADVTIGKGGRVRACEPPPSKAGQAVVYSNP